MKRCTFETRGIVRADVSNVVELRRTCPGVAVVVIDVDPVDYPELAAAGLASKVRIGRCSAHNPFESDPEAGK